MTDQCNTTAFAKLNAVKAESVRSALCRFGHYFGIVPTKLKNGRLLWPAVQVTVEGKQT
jgi:hypothetical protein